MNKNVLNILKEQGEISPIDYHFGRFITRLSNHDDSMLAVISAIVSRATREGNICTDLNNIAGSEIVPGQEIKLPEIDILKKLLIDSGHTGAPSEYKPLILDTRNRLYLYRYWHYENSLAEIIVRLSSSNDPAIDSKKLKESLERLFGRIDRNDFNYQQLAAFTALTRRFCVITGGPGTGKTTTVAAILALLLQQDSSLRIALTAPTGKAAARLQESIKNSIELLNCEQDIKDIIPRQASTTHRLLGSIPDSPYFRHNTDNRLPYDLVIVDEASMVDLPLLAKLAYALRDDSRLILIGDKDQLASVESGAALGDICSISSRAGITKTFAESYEKTTGLQIPAGDDTPRKSSLSDCIVELKKSYRFDKSSGIGELSRAVNEGRIEIADSILRGDNYNDLHWSELPPIGQLAESIKQSVLDRYSIYLQSREPREILDLFGEFQVLCAVREGPYGVSNINRLIELILHRAGKLDAKETWYRGRPVMILRNDYQLGLYNGDIGITLSDNDNPDTLKVYFPSQDGEPRKYSPIRLPDHETVYAMTIHKSQGSEFDKALLILPHIQSPLLTRELVYTGITRARSRLDIWSNIEIVKYAVEQKVSRESGLLDKLLND